jgi:hypothetical protein
MQPLTTQASGLVEENSVSVFIDMTSWILLPLTIQASGLVED